MASSASDVVGATDAGGATTTGLGSLVGWATVAAGGGLGGGGGGMRWIIGDVWSWGGGGTGGGRGHGGDILGTVLLVLAVAAGLCVALYWIYDRLEDFSKRTLRHAQHVVLDVPEDAPENFEHVD